MVTDLWNIFDAPQKGLFIKDGKTLRILFSILMEPWQKVLLLYVKFRGMFTAPSAGPLNWPLSWGMWKGLMSCRIRPRHSRSNSSIPFGEKSFPSTLWLSMEKNIHV